VSTMETGCAVVSVEHKFEGVRELLPGSAAPPAVSKAEMGTQRFPCRRQVAAGIRVSFHRVEPMVVAPMYPFAGRSAHLLVILLRLGQIATSS